MNKSIIVGAVIIVALFGAITVFVQNSNKPQTQENAMMKKEDTTDAMMKKTESSEGNESPEQEALEKQQGAMMKDTSSDMVLAGVSAQYLKFTQEEYEKALQSEKVIFLAFYANWCPLCRNEEPKLFEGFNELTTDQVIGFRVNYNDTDTDQAEKDLAKKYGVTYQTTKVILKNGKQIFKVTEEWDKATFLSEINKALQ